MKVEIPLVAEDIAEDRKLPFADVREHFIHNEFNVAVSILGELRGEGMRAKKSWNHRHVMISAKVVHDVKDLCFGVSA